MADLSARIAAANKLLASTPYKPVIYDTAQGLRLYVNRMGSGFASVDIAAKVNYGNMYFCGKNPSRRFNLPWGGTQERMIASVVTWVREPGFKWREDYWPRMVKDNSHWLHADAVAEFVARAAELRDAEEGTLTFDKAKDTHICTKHGDVGDNVGWVQCWVCWGEGGQDASADDPINYSPGEEWATCEVCRGNGGWRVCGECNANNPDVEW